MSLEPHRIYDSHLQFNHPNHLLSTPAYNTCVMTSNQSFGHGTNGTDVATKYASIVAGKIVLITGVSTGGIGDATARAFAQGGAASVIITGRDDGRLSEINQKLSAAYPSTDFKPFKLDLASLQSVRQFQKKILEDSSIPQIDFFIANAGINDSASQERTLTADGLETSWGVNHIAHFLLVTSLLPKIRKASSKNPPGATRVVILTSGATATSPVRFSDWNFDGKPIPADEKANWQLIKMFFPNAQETDGYDHNVAYGQSKTANVLMAVHLNRLLSTEGIYAFAVHPGFVESTGALRFLKSKTEEEQGKLFPMARKTIDQGSATTMVAALDPNLKPDSGVYMADCQFAEAPEWATSGEKAERLWKLSEQIVEEKV